MSTNGKYSHSYSSVFAGSLSVNVTLSFPDSGSENLQDDESSSENMFVRGGYEIGHDGITKAPEETPTTNQDFWPDTLTTSSTKRKTKMKAKISQEDLIYMGSLGQGNSGSVIKALHLDSLTYLAIKIMDAQDEPSARQTMHELDAFRKLDHSTYVVSFYGAYYDSDQNICLAMEYMDGLSLEEFCRNHGGELPEPIIRHFAFYLTKGIQYLHNHKIFHRDIKPSNILVHHNGSVKITDFGLVKRMGRLSRTNTFKGTRGYMSPERLKVEPYGYSSDIWSLGLCLVYCATGKNPFESLGDWNCDIVEEFDLRKSDIEKKRFSDNLCSFVSSCLVVDQEKRSTPQGLLQHEFLNEIFKSDIKGTDCWKTFFRKYPCSNEEFEIVICQVAQNMFKHAGALFQDNTRVCDATISRLVAMTNHTSASVRKALIKKLENLRNIHKSITLNSQIKDSKGLTITQKKGKRHWK